MTDEPTPAPAAGEDALWQEAREMGLLGPDAKPNETDEPKAVEAPPEAVAEPEKAEPDNIWATAPDAAKQAYDALKAERDDLEHKWKSEKARVPALTRKINELTRPPARKEPAAPDALDASIASLRESYPDVGEGIAPIGEAVKALRGEIGALTAAQRAAAEATTERVVAQVYEAHPDMDTVLEDGAAFLDWVEDQPKRIRSLFDLNKDEFVDAKAATTVLDLYKQHLGIAPPAQAAEAAPETRPDKRQRQLQGSASPAPTGRAVTSEPEPTTEQELWEAANKALDKRYGKR